MFPENKKLKELNSLSPITKKIFTIIIGFTVLITVGFSIWNINQGQKAKEQVKSSLVASLIQSYYPNESTMIQQMSQRTKDFKAYATYDIGFTSDIDTPEGMLYKIGAISGVEKSRINYFSLEDGTYLRSVYNIRSEKISSNIQITDEKQLDIWEKFDQLQAKIARDQDGDKVDVKQYKDIEDLLSKYTYLKN